MQDARVLPAGLHRRRNREEPAPWGDNERDSTAENTATAHSIVCTRVLSLLLLPCSLSTLPQ